MQRGLAIAIVAARVATAVAGQRVHRRDRQVRRVVGLACGACHMQSVCALRDCASIDFKSMVRWRGAAWKQVSRHAREEALGQGCGCPPGLHVQRDAQSQVKGMAHR